MFPLLSQAKPVVEFLYFVSGIVIAAAAVYGLQQIRLMKQDMELRANRASKEKAIEQIARYFSQYVPLEDTFYAECSEQKLDGHRAIIDNFDPSSLSPQVRSRALRRYKLQRWVPALNELQVIAASFAYGIADDTVGFHAIGRTFCQTVAAKYDIICLCRGDAAPYYQAIVDLYRVWAPRLTKAELDAIRRNAEEQLAILSRDSSADGEA